MNLNHQSDQTFHRGPLGCVSRVLANPGFKTRMAETWAGQLGNQLRGTVQYGLAIDDPQEAWQIGSGEITTCPADNREQGAGSSELSPESMT